MLSDKLEEACNSILKGTARNKGEDERDMFHRLLIVPCLNEINNLKLSEPNHTMEDVKLVKSTIKRICNTWDYVAEKIPGVIEKGAMKTFLDKVEEQAKKNVSNNGAV